MAAAACAAAACAFTASPARAAGICGNGMYSYAGLDGSTPTRGVSAGIAQAGPLDVHKGHVAGWIGVVDPQSGNAWLQVGLSALPGQPASDIYYEIATPGHAPAYHLVRAHITAWSTHRFAVLELRSRPSWWRIWVDGRPVTPPLHLAGSHRRWTAQVLGESWAGTATGACNAYAYSFTNVSLKSGTTAEDPNYAVVRSSHSSFVAGSRSTITARAEAIAAH